MDRAHPHETTRSRLRSSLGLLLLVTLLLPLLWLRASAENTLWIDEIHSLQLSQLPVSRLLDESARDVHPPGYALALKAWIRAGRILGLDPGLVWARALNVVVWLSISTLYWLLGGALLGRSGGALLTLCVVGSASAAVAVRDLRSYALVFGALAVAVLLLSVLESGHRFRRPGPLWTGYAVALTVALWCHLLAAPVVVLLSLAWLAVALGTAGGRDAERLAPGVVAHLVPWLLFLPWLVEVPGQLAQIRHGPVDWMTPATLDNLMRVFSYWLPLGRIGAPSPDAGVLLTALGALALAAPLGAGLWAWRTGRHRSPAATLSRLALPTAVGSVFVYWLLARLVLAPSFHGPRYPMLVGGVLAAGLAGAALARARRLGASAALLSFWLAAGLVGQVLAVRQEAAPGGLTAFRPQVEELSAGKGSRLFVTPSELVPFLRGSFPAFDLRPVEELVCAAPDEAVVLDSNPWNALDRVRDVVLERAILSRRLAAGVERRDWRDEQTTAVLYRLEGIDRALAGELCARGLGPLRTVPPDVVASASAEDQLAGDGWSYLELDERLDARRWGARSEARIRFDRVVPPGDYLLHLVGGRQPHPRATLDLELHLEGGGLAADPAVGPGPFHLVLPVSLERSLRPVLHVRHPLWSPSAALGSNDSRQLSFLFDAAWLAPAPV